MTQITWLGIDPGISRLGWAVISGEETETPYLLDCGTIETDKSLPTPARLLEIETDLIELVREFEPDGVAVEMPFFDRHIKAAGKVIQALGIVNLVVYRELELVPVLLHQASWKCHLGNGRAHKDEIAIIVQHLFEIEKLPVDDAVDAVGIAYAGFCGLCNAIE
jgi:crossover junction endodeoxyribonuclease RuvC